MAVEKKPRTIQVSVRNFDADLWLAFREACMQESRARGYEVTAQAMLEEVVRRALVQKEKGTGGPIWTAVAGR